jgi:hypothetical protein
MGNIRGKLAGQTSLNPYYGDISIIGDLSVSGNTSFTSVVYKQNSEIVLFNDEIIELNSGYTGSNYLGLSGFEVQLGTEPNAGFVYDGSLDKFQIGTLAKESLLTSTNSGPYIFGTDNKFKINLDTKGSVEVTLNDGTTEDVVNQLNNALYDSSYDYYDGYQYFQVTEDDKIRIRSDVRGTLSQIEIESITNDSYTILGFTTGTTTNGVDANLVDLSTGGGGGGIPYVPTAVEDNIAIFDNTGAIKDSGYSVDDLILTEIDGGTF